MNHRILRYVLLTIHIGYETALMGANPIQIAFVVIIKDRNH